MCLPRVRAVPCSAPRHSHRLVRSGQRIRILFLSFKVPGAPTQNCVLSFYSQDQGSRIMQHSWLEALKQSDGSPFLGDSLGRAAPVSWIFRVFYSGWTLRGRDRLFSCVEPAACPFIDLTAIFLVSLQGLTPNIS
jgi:hypothetical protein